VRLDAEAEAARASASPTGVWYPNELWPAVLA
jgi:hypothetical protein